MTTYKWDTDAVALMQARKERREDESVRRTMGLLRAGYVWDRENFRSEPRELWVACDGVEYIKLGPGRYRRRDGRMT